MFVINLTRSKTDMFCFAQLHMEWGITWDGVSHGMGYAEI